MVFTISLFLLPFILATILLACILSYLLYRNQSDDIPGITFASASIASFILILLTVILELASTVPRVMLIINATQYVFILSSVSLLFCYILVYTGWEAKLTRQLYGILTASLLLLCVVLATNPVHALFRAEATLETSGTLLIYTYQFGPAYYLFYAYIFVLVVIMVILLGAAAIEHTGRYRLQSVLLLVTIALPSSLRITSHVVDSSQLYPVGPYFGIVVLALILAWSTFRYDLFTAVPVARRSIIEQMDDGAIICDSNGMIIDTNPKARLLLGVDDHTLAGRQITDVINPVEDTFNLEFISRHRSNTLGFDDKIINVTATPLVQFGTQIGSLVMLRDVTELETKRVFERQTDHLEQLINATSHDMRNPINVIDGWTDLVATETDVDVAPVKRATRRLNTLTETVLELAQAGKAVHDPQRVTIESVTRRAWNALDAENVTITNHSDRTVVADPVRLEEAFTNLFRNVIETVDGTTTVLITDTSDGISLVIDTIAYSTTSLDHLFDWKTQTTTDDNFELAIAARIFELHGWSITAREQSTGGIQFVLSGMNDPIPVTNTGHSTAHERPET